MFALLIAFCVLLLCVMAAVAHCVRHLGIYQVDEYEYPTLSLSEVATQQSTNLTVIATIPSFVYHNGDLATDDTICAVCLDEYISGVSTVKTLSCTHHFHADCIDRTLIIRCRCPLCMRNINSSLEVAKDGIENQTAVRTQVVA
jgi:hypothetical protein